MNNPFKQVKEFHKAFGHPHNEQPTPMGAKDANGRSVWTGEELVEFIYASADDAQDFEEAFDQFIKGLYKAKDDTIRKNPDVSNKIVAQADALTDILYFVYGSFVQLGVEPQPLFDIVQQANMGKLWDDGQPHYREEDGKIQKPPHWQENFAPEPKLKAEIERQSKE